MLLKGGDGGPIGSVGVFPTAIPVGKGEPEIGYWIAHPYWGQGLIPEAVEELLIPYFLPFNAFKTSVNSTLTVLLYKPVVTALRKAKLVPESEHAAPPVAGKKRLGVYLAALVVLATLILLGFVLADKI